MTFFRRVLLSCLHSAFVLTTIPRFSTSEHAGYSFLSSAGAIAGLAKGFTKGLTGGCGRDDACTQQCRGFRPARIDAGIPRCSRARNDSGVCSPVPSGVEFRRSASLHICGSADASIRVHPFPVFAKRSMRVSPVCLYAPRLRQHLRRSDGSAHIRGCSLARRMAR
jgi:hypothetical protein